MEKLNGFLHTIDSISIGFGKIVSHGALLMMGSIIYDVTARYFFFRPTIWAEETGRFLLTGYFLLGGAYTLCLEAHVKMDVLYGRLSPRKRAILDLFTASIFFFLMFILLWYGFEMAWKSIKTLERTESIWAPFLFPVKICIPIGCFILFLQGLAKFIRDFIIGITGIADETKRA